MRDDLIELLTLIRDHADEIENEHSDIAAAHKALAQKYADHSKAIDDLLTRIEETEEDEDENEDEQEEENNEGEAA